MATKKPAKTTTKRPRRECSACRYAVKIPGRPDERECRRYPPSSGVVIISRHYWCGEWTAREAKK